jgi:hypothetical protein
MMRFIGRGWKVLPTPGKGFPPIRQKTSAGEKGGEICQLTFSTKKLKEAFVKPCEVEMPP